MNLASPKNILIGVVAIVVVAVIIVISLSSQPASKNTTTVTTSGTVEGTVTYTGTDDLVRKGLSSSQVEDTKVAVTNFAGSTKLKLTSVAFKNIIPFNEPSNPPEAHMQFFELTLNGNAVYRAKLNYTNADKIRLVLSQQNKQLYDSGFVKH